MHASDYIRKYETGTTGMLAHSTSGTGTATATFTDDFLIKYFHIATTKDNAAAPVGAGSYISIKINGVEVLYYEPTDNVSFDFTDLIESLLKKVGTGSTITATYHVHNTDAVSSYQYYINIEFRGFYDPQAKKY